MLGAAILILAPLGWLMTLDKRRVDRFRADGMEAVAVVVGLHKSPSAKAGVIEGGYYADVVFDTHTGREVVTTIGLTDAVAEELAEHRRTGLGPEVPILYLARDPQEARHAGLLRYSRSAYVAGQTCLGLAAVGLVIWLIVCLGLRNDHRRRAA